MKSKGVLRQLEDLEVGDREIVSANRRPKGLICQIKDLKNFHSRQKPFGSPIVVRSIPELLGSPEVF